MSEHLVAAAGDRLLRRGGHPEQNVPDAVSARLTGPREVEAARPVVQKSRIRGAERERDERVRLVPRRADGVVPEALGLEPARCVIDRPALDPRAPRRVGLRRDGIEGTRRRQGAESVHEMLLEGVEIVGHGRRRVR